MLKMPIQSARRGLAAVVAVFAFPAMMLVSDPAGAMGDPPKPKVDCTKKSNKTKPECQQHKDGMSDDEIYNSAYWLAKTGNYQAALDMLRTAKNQAEPRILNYTGFATRKLGRVDEAMGYYARALAANPDYTMARAYLGEAYLQKGEPDKAREQLAEIKTRRGIDCEEYAELASQIEAYERDGAVKG